MPSYEVIEISMAIIGFISATQVLPQIHRVIKRRSAADLSLWSQGLGLFFQTTWLIYSFYHRLPAMIAAGISWLAILSVLLGVTIYYKKRA